LKIELFSWPSVYLILYQLYIFTIIEVKIASFNDILSDQHKYIHSTPFPRKNTDVQNRNLRAVFFAINSCCANSEPLSEVMVWIGFLYAISIRIVAFARDPACLPNSIFPSAGNLFFVLSSLVWYS
jgi:hypothetical protein